MMLFMLGTIISKYELFSLLKNVKQAGVVTCYSNLTVRSFGNCVKHMKIRRVGLLVTRRGGVDSVDSVDSVRTGGG